jgi:hypothetical protein
MGANQSLQLPQQYVFSIWLSLKVIDISYLCKDVQDKHVCLDLGDELGSCPEVVELFAQCGCKVELMVIELSNQNGPVCCARTLSG